MTQAQMQTAMRQLQAVPKKGPRVGLAAIRSSHNIQTALELHRNYIPPHFEEMEPVYFRKVGGGDERVAFVLYENNKHFALYVLKENHLPEVIRSASYFDPEDEANSDPKGPHNSANGVFRRSGMGTLFKTVKERMQLFFDTIERISLSAVENAERVSDLTKRVEKLESSLRSLET